MPEVPRHANPIYDNCRKSGLLFPSNGQFPFSARSFFRIAFLPRRASSFWDRDELADEKTGPVIAMKVVDGEDDILMVADDGTIIRTDVASISVYGRATQGVRVMRVAEGSQVISIAATDKEDSDEDPEE